MDNYNTWIVWLDPGLAWHSREVIHTIGKTLWNDMRFTLLSGFQLTKVFRAGARLAAVPTLVFALNEVSSAAVFVSTLPAATVDDEIRLRGIVGANGLPVQAWFEWGKDSVSENRSSIQTVSSDADFRVLGVTVPRPTTREIHRCRLVASNQVEVVYGTEEWFTGGGSVIIWGDFSQLEVPSDLHDVVGVSVGNQHCMALRANGSVMGWGYSTGWSLRPDELTNAISICSGPFHNLAVRSDGSVWAWGANEYAVCDVPLDLAPALAVAASYQFSAALMMDGTVRVWGQSAYATENMPSGLSRVTSISCGGLHTLALKLDGTVVAWGDNSYGQCDVPIGLSNVVRVATGVYSSFAITRAGGVISWGNKEHQETNIPEDFTNIVSIAAGYLNGVAQRSVGTVSIFGYPDVPQPPADLSHVSMVAGRQMHFLAIGNRPPATEENRRVVIAANHDAVIRLSASDPEHDARSFQIVSLAARGQLFQCAEGLRGEPIVSVPADVNDHGGRIVYLPETDAIGDPYSDFHFRANDGLETSADGRITIAIVGAPYSHTQPATPGPNATLDLHAMVTPNGFSSVAWFEIEENGMSPTRTANIEVGSGANVVRISTQVGGLNIGTFGIFHAIVSNTFGLTEGRKVPFSFGRKVSVWGEQGTTVPNGLGPVIMLTAGGSRTFAITLEGTLAQWPSFPLGSFPSNLGRVVDVGAGLVHQIVIREDGSVIAWGDNEYGQTNLPAGLSQVIAVSGGWRHSIALKEDGRVVAWGDNDVGQGEVPEDLKNVVAVSAGLEFNVALVHDGSVTAWGKNLYGATNVPEFKDLVVAVSAGDSRAFALTKSGAVVGWGEHADVPEYVSNVTAIAAGSYHCLALTGDRRVLAWGDNRFGQAVVPADLNDVSLIAGGSVHSVSLGANRAPVASSKTVSGYPNQDLMISLSGTDPNGDPLAFRIQSLPTKGTLYQRATTGARGAEVNEAGTHVQDAGGRMIFAPLIGEFGTAYSQFGFITEDGEFASATGTITVDLALPAVPRFISTEIDTNGGFTTQFRGQSNATYRVWASTNLVDWTNLEPAIIVTPGIFRITDSNVFDHPYRFFRATAP